MNNLDRLIYTCSVQELLETYPILDNFLENLRITDIDRTLPFPDAIQGIQEETLLDFGLTSADILDQLFIFLEHFSTQTMQHSDVASITLIGGQDKNGVPEDIHLTISQGEIISIVGPTGSGKSRLLEDIECLAQGDTPTKRSILLNGTEVQEEIRFELNGKLVAQLSQNMNFVMDLTVREFLEMHARCRLSENFDATIEKCFVCANDLAGEKFTIDTKVTQLSGGQSRALMIADTAYMSTSPIVLVDEIENAGINRKEAIALLAKKEKIVLLSTHDPLLALNADKRIVIKNGGISKVLATTEQEKISLHKIEQLDNTLQHIREELRHGERISIEEEGR